MGMDVYGKNPTSETGKYFRNNVWWWRPLWRYCEGVAPVTRKVVYAQSNDGDGLDARDSKLLATALRAEIESGRTAMYAAEYTAQTSALARETCKQCHGLGVRTDAIGIANDMVTRVVPSVDPANPRAGKIGWCNGCDGWGTCEPYDAMYPFSVENVQRFAAFLEVCGGFEIN